jgi:hypothetical protein
MDIDKIVGGLNLEGSDHIQTEEKAKKEKNPAGRNIRFEDVYRAPQRQYGKPSKKG